MIAIWAWVVLAVGWGLVSRELTSGRRNLTRLEAYTMFGVLSALTVRGVLELLP